MTDRFFSRGRGIFLFSWELGILAFFLSVFLPACTITPLSSNCSGKNISCGNVGSTILSPDSTAQALAVATVNALQKQEPLMSDPLNSQDSNSWADDANCYFYNGT